MLGDPPPNAIPEIYGKPGGRTEVDVAADVILRLLVCGKLARDQESLKHISKLVGVPLWRIKMEWQDKEDLLKKLALSERRANNRETLTKWKPCKHQ